VRQLECEFEADVLAAAVQSRWPDRLDAGLRAHVTGCAICADVAAVASAIACAREETVALVAEAHALPDAGRVLWTARMRARREAVAAAGRPITVVQVVALACAMGLMGACIGATSGWFQLALRRTWGWVAGLDVRGLAAYAVSVIASHGVLVLCMLGMVLGLPLAVYLVVVRD